MAGDPVLERVDAIVAAGAPELALRLLQDSPAPPPVPGESRWEDHERRRLQIHRSLNDVDGIAARLAALPASASPALRRYALGLLAEAKIEAGDAEGAHRILQQVIEENPDEQREALARLAALALDRGRLQEARSLLDRAGADGASEDIQRLRAEIDLREGRPRAALARASALGSAEGRLLALTAALRAKTRPPGEVLADAQRLAQAKETAPSLRRAAWTLRAEAARRAGQLVREIGSLEQALALPGAGGHAYLAASADDLWAAYGRLAQAVGRGAGLSQDDASAWLAQAEAYATEDGHYARALYAFAAQTAGVDTAREAAQVGLAESLLAAGLPATLDALYPPSMQATLPAAVRQRLLDAALARGDFKHAVALMDGLPPPSGDAASRWNLRRARVLLYAGYRHEALVLLSGLLDGPGIDEGFAGAYLQVVFDLQALELHQEALVLMEAVYKRVDNPRMRRELLYWQADSLTARGRHAEAAEYYLRSATHGGASPSDPWGQAARFRAAEALVRARLVSDARSIYAALLTQTTDPARRAAIEQQMQQLWLTGKATTP
ncbi:hypothetical protein SVA_2375 [Sulfurifustis variabilis]|uniref:Uncharacterized protein n=1 Tax=Sulfurifustis variabilis TaxID=1675686 RepID=A0A1B4V636_9GAMM|nr:tetratricopeptide repeat protein [Sulfurifustis variabilis]BAU48925.1 hypothetical protein SVA_2375 [Sulfurifustis variabilis]